MRSASFAALSLALLLGGPGAGGDDYITKDGTACPLQGTATSEPGQELNRAKNRHTAPGQGQIDPEVSLAAMLAPGNDIQRFDPKRGARVTGFVIDVKSGGKETCNCEATAAADVDTHIELALSQNAPGTERVIVEVTPRLRKQVKDSGEDWNTQALRTRIKGKWVEVTGWLMFDVIHIDEAENTNPGGDGNWRATCWEVHPVTGIKILESPPAALANVPAASVAAMRRAHAEHVTQDPKAREAIASRNKKYLDQFTPRELEEKEAETKERRR
jgi:hypothetical protein